METPPKAPALSLPSAATFNTVSQAEMTPSHTIILLLLYDYNFAIFMNCNINIYVYPWSQATTVKGVESRVTG